MANRFQCWHYLLFAIRTKYDSGLDWKGQWNQTFAAETLGVNERIFPVFQFYWRFPDHVQTLQLFRVGGYVWICVILLQQSLSEM